MERTRVTDSLKIDGYEIEVTNRDKVLFSTDGITKGELIEYYRRIADVMLPYLRGRPLTMQRFPDGLEGESFYQKEISDYFPDWIKRATVKKGGGSVNHVICEDVATLVYLADQACITHRVWLSRIDRLHNPDMLVFNLNPAGGDFEPVRKANFSLRELLEELGLGSNVKTPGLRGTHVVVPLDRTSDFKQAWAFARDVAGLLVKRDRENLTGEQRKEKRKSRILVDYLRNSYAQTAVAPYAIRAIAGAPVAAPLEWEELADRGLGPQSYNIKNIFRRLSGKDDPWAGMWRKAYSLEKAGKRLETVAGNRK